MIAAPALVHWLRRYVPESDVPGTNVLQLELEGPTGPQGTLPPGLQAASEVAGGRLGLSAALALPPPGPTITLTGGGVGREGEGVSKVRGTGVHVCA